MCVCVREREREGGREGGREKRKSLEVISMVIFYDEMSPSSGISEQ